MTNYIFLLINTFDCLAVIYGKERKIKIALSMLQQRIVCFKVTVNLFKGGN